jgi:hypothetical protein
MDAVLLIITAIGFYGMTIGKKFNTQYLSKDNTASINGIFVLFVFLRHFSQYITFSKYDYLFDLVDTFLGQMIVVPFLFYSGYGIMISIINKGDSYIKTIPRKRFLKVWYHYMLAVGLFIIMNYALDINFGWEHNLLTLTGWDAIGNSNWYIMAMLFLYIFTFIAFSICKKHYFIALCIVTLLSIAYIVVLSQYKSGYWINTIVAYPTGMIFAKYKSYIEKAVNINMIVYLSVLTVFLAATIVCRCITIKHDNTDLLMYEITSFLFSISLALLTMRVNICNRLLVTLGKYTFEIYILQRIPMILFNNYIHGEYKYFIVCFVATIIISVLFKMFTNLTDKLLIYKTRKKPYVNKH